MNFDSIIEATANSTGSRILAENNNASSINWVRGLSDPGEMLGCGKYPQLRRTAGETDSAYFARLQILLTQIPAADRARIESAMVAAANARAGTTSRNGKILLALADSYGWQELGTVVRGAMTGAEALHFSGIDGLIYVKRPNLFIGLDGNQYPTGGFAVIRDDANPPIVIAPNVGAGYEILTPADMVSLLDGLMGAGLEIESIGAIDDGRSLWVQARMPKAEGNIAGDEHTAYVLVRQAMDGTGALTVHVTIERAVCKNTVRLAMSSGKKVASIRHTKNARDRFPQVREALREASSAFDAYCERAAVLRATTIDAPAYYDGMLDVILDKTIAGRAATGAALRDGSLLSAIAQIADADEKHRAELALSRFEKSRVSLLDQILERHQGERNGNGAQDAWHCAQTVIETVQHGDVIRYRGEGRARAEAVAVDQELGRADDLKQEALNSVLNFAR